MSFLAPYLQALGRLRYPIAHSPAEPPYVVNGIDVSHYQGDVDFVKVRNSGRSFVYMKAVEGRTALDSRFAENHARATDAGMIWGAYQFAAIRGYATRARDQARAFRDVVGDRVGPGMLPPVIDLETRATLSSKAALVEWLAEWCDETQTLWGREPIVYTGVNYWRSYLGNDSAEAFRHLPLWIARYPQSRLCPPHRYSPPAEIPGWPCKFWQWTGHGSCPGVKGNCDLNVYKGTLNELRALAGVEVLS